MRHSAQILFNVFCLAFASLCAAALPQTTPQVVTLLNGTQYVGQTATVPAFSAEQPNPWNSQQIALVDDGVRRFFFSRRSVGNVSPLGGDHPLANPTEFEIPQRTYSGSTRGIGQLIFGPFNEFGHRIVQSKSDEGNNVFCLLYTSPSPRDRQKSRMPSSA